jgi:hypothetical protein
MTPNTALPQLALGMSVGAPSRDLLVRSYSTEKGVRTNECPTDALDLCGIWNREQ